MRNGVKKRILAIILSCAMFLTIPAFGVDSVFQGFATEGDDGGDQFIVPEDDGGGVFAEPEDDGGDVFVEPEDEGSGDNQEPGDESSEPDDESSEPDDESSEPDDESSEPDDESSEPDDESSEPDDESSEPDDAEYAVAIKFAEDDDPDSYGAAYTNGKKDYDLLDGVSAADEKGESVEVTVIDDGGFNTAAVWPNNEFTVTYEAKHPADETVTAVRERIIYVTLGLEDINPVLANIGTVQNPLKLENAADLWAFAENWNTPGADITNNKLREDLGLAADAYVYVQLTADVNVGGKEWAPIGAGAYPFFGEFDGKGHAVKNLTIETAGENKGLFGGVGGNLGSSTISNLGIEDCYIKTTGSNVGGLAGYFRGTVTKCYVTGRVEGNNSVGGIIGGIAGGINYSYSTCDVIGTGGVIGGIAGLVTSGATVFGCYSTGNVTGSASAIGGVAGSSDGNIINCYSRGNVKGAHAVGGVLGNNIDGGKVSGCYATGSVSGETNSTGGIQGQVRSSVDGVENCVALNPEIIRTIGSVASFGRIAGEITNPATVSKNRAFVDMIVAGSKVTTGTLNNKDGQNIGGNAIATATTWANDVGFPDGDWIFEDGKLPILKNVVNPELQTGEIPEYITSTTVPPGSFAGSGTADDPYLIYTPEQLKKVADAVNTGTGNYPSAYYKLMNDIDLSGYANWTPIGTHPGTIPANYKPFQGNFDGNGFAVKNLKTTSGGDYKGLFGYTLGAVISNLGVENISIDAATQINNAGGVVGYAVNTTITYCYSTGSISGTSGVGGIVGNISNSTISKCYSACTIDAKWGGGVVGMGNGNINNCYSTGSVIGTVTNAYVGGVVGYLTSGTVLNCYATGNVSGYSSGGGASVGGVVGATQTGVNVESCVALNLQIIVSGGVLARVGRATGLKNNWALSTMKYTASHNLDEGLNKLDGEDISEALARTASSTWWIKTGTEGPGFDGDNIWYIVDGKYPLLRNVGGQTIPDPDISDLDDFEGDGTSTAPYRIWTAAQLAKVARFVNANRLDARYSNRPYANAYYWLMDDVDLSAYPDWTPIANMNNIFRGNFNGQGNVVKNLKITGGDGYTGLFGRVTNGGTVYDLGVVDCDINTTFDVGSVVGFLTGGSVSNCYVTGSVKGSGQYVGGVVGHATGETTKVTNCYSLAIVNGSVYVGGVVGFAESASVTGCYSTGSVSGISSSGGVGGVVGYMTGANENTKSKVENCYSTGSVSGRSSVGGVVGIAFSYSTITNCVALNPSVSSTNINVGRVVGRLNGGSLSNNYAWASMPGTWNNKGLTNKDGADATVDGIRTPGFWENTVKFGNNWKLGWFDYLHRLPIIKGVGGPQIATLPYHLTDFANDAGFSYDTTLTGVAGSSKNTLDKGKVVYDSTPGSQTLEITANILKTTQTDITEWTVYDEANDLVPWGFSFAIDEDDVYNNLIEVTIPAGYEGTLKVTNHLLHNVNAIGTLYVEFKNPNVNVTVKNGGNGAVTFNADNVPADDTGVTKSVAKNSESVTITVKPDEDYELNTITGAILVQGGTDTNGVTTYTYTPTADTIITITFKPQAVLKFKSAPNLDFGTRVISFVRKLFRLGDADNTTGTVNPQFRIYNGIGANWTLSVECDVPLTSGSKTLPDGLVVGSNSIYDTVAGGVLAPVYERTYAGEGLYYNLPWTSLDNEVKVKAGIQDGLEDGEQYTATLTWILMEGQP